MIRLQSGPMADYRLGDFEEGDWVRLIDNTVACIFHVNERVDEVGVLEFTDTHNIPQVVYYNLGEPCQEVAIKDIDIVYEYKY